MQRLGCFRSDTLKNPGVLVACRLMPELADRIHMLAAHDEAFLELCDDPAAAQRALEGPTLVPDVLRRHRLADAKNGSSTFVRRSRAPSTPDGIRPDGGSETICPD